MTKNKGNTGFRNGKLFCFNCGGEYEIIYPQPVSMATALMTQFAKDHENCEKTWVEPTNEVESKSEAENANWWALNGEHGISSMTMFNHFTRNIQVRAMKLDHPKHPYDPDDFSRCYKLLKAVPQFKARINELKELSPEWANLVDNWDKLTEMYEENVRMEWKTYKRIGMYDFMQTLIR